VVPRGEEPRPGTLGKAVRVSKKKGEGKKTGNRGSPVEVGRGRGTDGCPRKGMKEERETTLKGARKREGIF